MAAALLRGGHTHLWQSRVRDLSDSSIPYGLHPSLLRHTMRPLNMRLRKNSGKRASFIDTDRAYGLMPTNTAHAFAVAEY